MSRDLSLAEEHGRRIERVIQWLADNLDESVDFRRLSEVACLSPYHFHRLYHALQGETVNETLRRLRLHRAAVELIAGERKVLEIGRRAGYASLRAFVRAFKVAYGVPPGKYRAAFVAASADGKRKDSSMRSNYEVAILEKEAIPLAALPHRGDYMRIGHTFERLQAIARRLDLVGPETRSFGIYYDDPTVIAADALRADACLSLPRGAVPSDVLEPREIPRGRYAVTLHVGPYAELEHAYHWLYASWLIESGEEPADFPCVEQYLNDWRAVPTTDLRTEIWLPLG